MNKKYQLYIDLNSIYNLGKLQTLLIKEKDSKFDFTKLLPPFFAFFFSYKKKAKKEKRAWTRIWNWTGLHPYPYPVGIKNNLLLAASFCLRWRIKKIKKILHYLKIDRAVSGVTIPTYI